MSTAALTIEVLSDVSKGEKGLDRIGKASSGARDNLSKAGQTAGVVAGVIGGLGALSVRQASEMEQSGGAIEAVFKRQSDAVKRLAENTRDGLDTAEYENLATVLGAQLKNMGTETDQLANKTGELIGLGGDLAAQFGGSTSEAVSALSSLLRGERDPIERYGVSINEAAIKAQMLKDGTASLEGEQRKAAETQALMTLLMEQTADAQGAASREAESFQSSQERAFANAKDAAGEFGKAALPLFADLMDRAAGWATQLGEHPDLIRNVALGIGGLAIGIWGLNAAVTAYEVIVKAVTIAQKAWTAAQWLWNAAMAANPIFLIILGIGLLIAALVLAYKKSETFRDIVNGAFGAVRDAGQWVIDKVQGIYDKLGGWNGIWDRVQRGFKAAWDLVTGPLQVGYDLIMKIIEKVDSLRDKLSSIKFPSMPSFNMPDLFGQYTPPGGGLAPDVFTAPGGLKAASAGLVSYAQAGARGGVTIIINGAVDPASTARQLQRVLGDARISQGYPIVAEGMGD